MTHHLDEKFLEQDRRRQETMASDGLPCGIQEVPKQLYVNSDLALRKTEDIQKELLRETLYRSEFNKFINSKEGKNYYLGVLPDKKKKLDPLATGKKQKAMNDNAYSGALGSEPTKSTLYGAS